MRQAHYVWRQPCTHAHDVQRFLSASMWCVYRGTHTHTHGHMCARACALARRLNGGHPPHACCAGVCVKKTTVTFSSVVSHINPYHRSLSVAHVTAADTDTDTDAHRHSPTHNRSKHTRHNQNLYNHNDKPSHRILTWPGCLSDHQGIASRRAHRSLHFERRRARADGTLTRSSTAQFMPG